MIMLVRELNKEYRSVIEPYLALTRPPKKNPDPGDYRR
jgi:hypothetical protein